MLSVEDDLNKQGLLKGIGGIRRFIASPTLRAIGHQLVAMHKPATINYAARFGLAAAQGSRTVSTASDTRPRRVASAPTLRSATRRQARPTYRHCGSEQLTLQPGRFSFHFTCTTCGQHTLTEIGCGKAGHRERIRPDGRTFYRACPACRTRAVFIVNPEKRDVTCP
jgi:hypothetical protein